MKKTIKYFAIFIALFLLAIPCAYAEGVSKSYVVCHDANVLKGIRVLGYVVMVLKILAPIILIIMGMYSFFKATLDDDDKATKEAARLLFTKFCIAAGIFFIPTIVSAIFNALSLIGDNTDYNVCIQCVTNVTACDTSNVVGGI